MILQTRTLKYYELEMVFVWCQNNDIMFTPPYFGDPYSLLLYVEDDKLITYATLKWNCTKFQYGEQGIV